MRLLRNLTQSLFPRDCTRSALASRKLSSFRSALRLRANGCNCCVTSQLIRDFNDTLLPFLPKQIDPRWVSPRNLCSVSTRFWNIKDAILKTKSIRHNIIGISSILIIQIAPQKQLNLPRLRLEEYIALHMSNIVTIIAEYSRQRDIMQLS